MLLLGATAKSNYDDKFDIVSVLEYRTRTWRWVLSNHRARRHCQDKNNQHAVNAKPTGPKRTPSPSVNPVVASGSVHSHHCRIQGRIHCQHSTTSVSCEQRFRWSLQVFVEIPKASKLASVQTTNLVVQHTIVFG